MKNRSCDYCDALLLANDKIITKNNEFLSVEILGKEHNWCNDNCYEKWFIKEVYDNITHVDKPELYFKD